MRYGFQINRRRYFLAAAIFFALAAICTSLYCFPEVCYADTPVAGTVNNGPVRLRTAPVDGETVTTLTAGTAVTITEEIQGADGYLWYRIQVSSQQAEIGYIRSDYITLSAGAAGNTSNAADVNNAESKGADADEVSEYGLETNGTNVSGREAGVTVPNTADTEMPDANGAEGIALLSASTGVVANTSLGVYVRSGAGTSYSALTKVYKGQVVSILGQTSVGGVVWYQVSLTAGGNSYNGWISGDYVSVNGAASGNGSSGGTSSGDSTTVNDEAYVAALKAAGFPDSYCNSLLALHQKYPNWQFVAVQTGLDWNTVISEESKAGKNLVQSSSNDSRKSTDGAAYNWATNTWYGYDGASWVCAAPEFIAYCMDPRNFLNETDIYQFETLEYADYQNAGGVSNILSNTFMAGNYTDRDGAVRNYPETFLKIGRNLAVSPYHLASRCRQEQGTKGTSQLISGTYSGYEGYYNYFNIGAYTTSTGSATVNGLIQAQKNDWNTIYKSIQGGAAVVANNYIKKGQNTIYFEKFNVVYTNSLYSHQYMTNVQAAISEGQSMEKAYTDKNQAFVFRIPVYQNMPQSASGFTNTGNPNNWLSSLTVANYNLTPFFNGQTTEYSLVVGADVSSINVNAAAVAGTSQVSGNGNYSLNYGNNMISITCISQSGASRTYHITIARQNPSVTGTPITVADGAAITSTYPIGTYMTGISPLSSVNTILAGIATENCTVKILKADGSENTGVAGTGNKLTVYVNGQVVKQYEVVVYGDINGDGKISNVDVVLMQKQILGINSLSGSYLDAANTSKDGGVTNKDLVILQKHILNITAISQ